MAEVGGGRKQPLWFSPALDQLQLIGVCALEVPNEQCLLFPTVRCSANQPNIRTSPLGHPVGGNRLHRGRNAHLRCATGTYLSQVAKPVPSRGRHRLGQDQDRAQELCLDWGSAPRVRNNQQHPSAKATKLSSSSNTLIQTILEPFTNITCTWNRTLISVQYEVLLPIPAIILSPLLPEDFCNTHIPNRQEKSYSTI